MLIAEFHLLTVTASSNVIVMSIVSPSPNEPSVSVVSTPVTVGFVVSTTSAAFAPREPDAAGDASVRTACVSLVEVLLIVTRC